MRLRGLPIGLLSLVLFVVQARAAALVGHPRVSLVEAGVEIRWQTDVATGSRVQYGPVDSALTNRVNGEVGTNHLVVLRGLAPGGIYRYTVGTARAPLATNEFVVPGGRAAPIARASTPSRDRVGVQAQPQRQAPPTRQTWGNAASLPDHYARHGRDFNARDADEYARLAWEFLQRARSEHLPMKVDEDGVIRVFDPATRSFAAYNRDGTTKTFFKPESRDYFERQPGKPVQSQPRP